MALIVEDGTGVAGAESYASVAYADTYNMKRGREATWNDLDLDKKEQALILATDYIQQFYGQSWAGFAMSEDQVLGWPREYVPRAPAINAESVERASWYDNDIVPEGVKRATVELAYKVANGKELAPDQGPLAIEKTVGPLTVKYDKNAQQQTVYSTVGALLAPYLLNRGGTTRIPLVRA